MPPFFFLFFFFVSNSVFFFNIYFQLFSMPGRSRFGRKYSLFYRTLVKLQKLLKTIRYYDYHESLMYYVFMRGEVELIQSFIDLRRKKKKSVTFCRVSALQTKLNEEKNARQKAEVASQEKERQMSMLSVDYRQIQQRLQKLEGEHRQEAEKVNN